LESVNAGFGGRTSTIQYAGNERLCSFRSLSAVEQWPSARFKQSVNPRARSWCLRSGRGRHMAIPEVDKSLTKGFAGKSGERQKREWPHKHWGIYGGPGWT